MQNTSLAKDKFTKFVSESEQLYGQSFISVNVHNLLHLPDVVDFTGLNHNQLSAFSVEPYLAQVSKMIR